MSEAKIATKEQEYWAEFYRNWSISVPSQFCASVAAELKPRESVLEFGCGNGRDATFLSELGHSVFAMDISSEAIEPSKITQLDARGSELQFIPGDVANPKDVRTIFQAARSKKSSNRLIIYSRFFLHTLDDEQESSFLRSISDETAIGDLLFLEFRSLEDQLLQKIFSNHFRRYIDTPALAERLKNQYGFSIDYQITGQGMARYKEEDPFVSRIVATKL